MLGRPSLLRKVRGHTMIVIGGNGMHFQCSTEISYWTIYFSADIWGAVSICAMLARPACASSEHLKAKDFRTLIRMMWASWNSVTLLISFGVVTSLAERNMD